MPPLMASPQIIATPIRNAKKLAIPRTTTAQRK
jgi:hypothetical protein